MTMSAQEIEAALATIESSFSYESDRWMPSYAKLRTLEHELREQMKPYTWINLLFIWLGVATFIVALIANFQSSSVLSGNFLLSGLLYATLLIVPGAVMSFGKWLELRVAARLHPMLLFKSRVERATRRFAPQTYRRRSASERNV